MKAEQFQCAIKKLFHKETIFISGSEQPHILFPIFDSQSVLMLQYPQSFRIKNYAERQLFLFPSASAV